jgi:DNA-binding XRE family transcriptional regulator
MNERIRNIRKELGMTQDEFSAYINLSRNFITQIETGAKKPSDRTIQDICRVFMGRKCFTSG